MKKYNHKISIAIPVYDMEQTPFFLNRLIKSIYEQTFRDFEIVITNDGPMAKNHNAAISRSTGELIKLMQMDDYFAHPDALKDIVENFGENDTWMISACSHTLDGVSTFNDHFPSWNDRIYTGNNTLGGFSTLTIRNEDPLLLEEHLTWVVDCDLYQRYFNKFGLPKLLNSVNVVVDVGKHRLTGTLADELKRYEVTYLINKYNGK